MDRRAVGRGRSDSRYRISQEQGLAVIVRSRSKRVYFERCNSSGDRAGVVGGLAAETFAQEVIMCTWLHLDEKGDVCPGDSVQRHPHTLPFCLSGPWFYYRL